MCICRFMSTHKITMAPSWLCITHSWCVHEPQPCWCTGTMEPQPPNLSLPAPKKTCPMPSSDSAPAHMMHGSIVTYSWHLQRSSSTRGSTGNLRTAQ